MKNVRWLVILPLLALATAANAQDGTDWSKKTGVGGYVSWAHYPVADSETELTTQGLSLVYGLNPKLRAGANLGFFVSNRGGDTGGDITGFSIAPAASYDLVRKPGGSVYAVTHALAFDMVKNSGSMPDVWNLDILNAGVGIEALASRDVGIALEGDAFRFGMTRALGHTETTISALAFPAVRLIARMYF